MESNPPQPCSSLLPRSRLTGFFTFLLNSSKIQKTSSTPFIIVFFIFVFNIRSITSFITDSKDELTYKQHCHNLVPMSLLDPKNVPVPDISHSLGFHSGYFYGGDQLFNRISQHAMQFPKTVSFSPTEVLKTVTNGVYQIRARLRLQNQEAVNITRNSQNRNLRQIVYRGPKVLPLRRKAVFPLYGFWSESSRKLCMVGSKSNIVRHFGKIYTDVNIKFDYPKNSTIFGSFVSGIIETFSDKSSSDYFEPIFVLGLHKSLDYKYTLLDKEVENGCSDGYGSPNRHMEGACSVFLGRAYMLELKYEGDCHGVNCNPLGKNVDYLPKNMYFYGTQCTERMVQMLLSFPNPSYHSTAFPFHPDSMLIGEGLWNGKENGLCARACRILVSKDSEISASVSDCSIKLNLRFPETLSLRNRSNIVGQIWSEKAVDESGYFSRIGFQSIWNVLTNLQRLKYLFTETNMLPCPVKKTNQNKGRRYPSAYSSDMRFFISVKNSEGQLARGFASPLFVDDKLYDNLLYGKVQVGPTQVDKAKEIQPTNISYKMSFTSQGEFKINGKTALGEVQISAEGVYDMNWGLLCLRGCRHVGSTDGISLINETLDCEIMVNVQFPPLNAKKGEFVKGTIESTRHDSDPFYFHPLKLSSSSIYKNRAAETIWRMDLEIIMALLSNTLACMFLGLQLLYVKKHPSVLPLISMVMLVVLTLSHMIPLLLNFEALFIGNHSEKNIFLGSGGWLEMNEIIVRIVTMVAFLLQLLFLQMSWSARRMEENQQVLWISERKVLYVSLPLYVGGGLIAWYVHQLKSSGWTTFRPFRLSRHKLPKGMSPFRHQYLWEALTSYAGLLRDGFLLPQILFNIFHNSEGKTLAFSFYMGTTAIRLLPHAYDLYRAQTTPWYLDLVFIYASQKWDFYSTAWDIIIILCGFLFSVLICLQQRFGGRFMLPRRFKESSVYQIVPVITNDDL